jgi:hypothetical protein
VVEIAGAMDRVERGEIMCETKLINPIFYARNTWATDWYKCSACATINIAPYFNYCPMCGQALNWEHIREEAEK